MRKILKYKPEYNKALYKEIDKTLGKQMNTQGKVFFHILLSNKKENILDKSNHICSALFLHYIEFGIKRTNLDVVCKILLDIAMRHRK